MVGEWLLVIEFLVKPKTKHFFFNLVQASALSSRKFIKGIFFKAKIIFQISIIHFKY